jgi:hypothetical protein
MGKYRLKCTRQHSMKVRSRGIPLLFRWEGVGRINVAQEWGKGRAVVNTVMNSRVP